MSFSWEFIVSLIGGLGGIEIVKVFLNRRANARLADTQADVSEFEMLKNTMVFLQEQLKEKEVRFAEQTDAVRRLNTDVFDLIKQIGERDLTLARVRCNDYDCPFRTPPTAHTPPMPNLTREMYFAGRNEVSNDIKEKE